MVLVEVLSCFQPSASMPMDRMQNCAVQSDVHLALLGLSMNSIDEHDLDTQQSVDPMLTAA